MYMLRACVFCVDASFDVVLMCLPSPGACKRLTVGSSVQKTLSTSTFYYSRSTHYHGVCTRGGGEKGRQREGVCVWVCVVVRVFVRVCVYMRVNENGLKTLGDAVDVCGRMCACLCVCVRERDVCVCARERKRTREYVSVCAHTRTHTHTHTHTNTHTHTLSLSLSLSLSRTHTNTPAAGCRTRRRRSTISYARSVSTAAKLHMENTPLTKSG